MKHEDQIIEVYYWTEERAPRRNSGIGRVLGTLMMLLMAALIMWGITTLRVVSELTNGEIRVITRAATCESWTWSEHPYVDLGDTITTYSGAIVRYEENGIYVSQDILGARIRTVIPVDMLSMPKARVSCK